MVDDAGRATSTGQQDPAPTCPWCSATLPAAAPAVCPSCDAQLVEATDIEIPGVTAVDPALLAAVAAPRKPRRTIGSLLVGNGAEIPLPSEAEMPALARPGADVRREILSLEMEARLASLKAEVAARNAEGAAAVANEAQRMLSEPIDARPGTGEQAETGEPPGPG